MGSCLITQIKFTRFRPIIHLKNNLGIILSIYLIIISDPTYTSILHPLAISFTLSFFF